MPEWRQEIRARLTGLQISAVREVEIIEELSQHLEDRYRELRRADYSGADAFILALKELSEDGLLARTLRAVEREEIVEPIVPGARRTQMIADLLQDVRYGLRVLAKNPGFTCVAVITLALGIGANTAIFSLVNGILLRPLPYPESDRLVRVIQQNKTLGLDTWGVSQADFAIYRDKNQSFESIAAITNGGANLTGEGEPERIATANVTADFFKVLRVNPAMGRAFRAGEDSAGKNNVCVISNGLWMRRYGGDPNIVGKTLRLNDVSTEIIGVAPAGFQFPRPDTEAWVPFPLNPNKIGGPYLFRCIARLKAGIQPLRAEADTSSIVQAYGRSHKGEISESAGLDTPNGTKTIVTPLKNVIVGDTEKPLLVLLSTVGLVLLIACANVANLLLARATARTREMAVRFALGATPSRIARQLLTESLLLSLIGAVTGIAIASFALSMLDRFSVAGIPRLNEVTINGRVLAFTVGLALLTGLLFGMMPAIRAYNMGLATGMRQGARSSTSSRRLNSALVATQFALSLILLIGAALLMKSFSRLESVGLGFNPDGLLTMTASLPQRQEAPQFYTQLADRMRTIPGVKSAAVVTNLPFSNDSYEDNFIVEGQDNPTAQNYEREQAEYQITTPDAFKAMGIPFLAGRDFLETDTNDAPPVAIIDDTLASKYFPKGDAIGRRIESSGDQIWMSIVGIVGGVKHNNLAENLSPHIYIPITQFISERAFLVIRTEGSPAAMVSAVRNEVKRLNPDIPLYQIRPMKDIVGDTLTGQRLTNLLMTSFAVLALLLAAVGIYGTMSVYVGSRTNEFGIRLSLGAQPSKLLRSVLGEGLILTAVGIAVGSVGAFFLTRAIASLLFEVSATDPVIYTGVPIILVAVATLACYVPARRASRVDPIVALRYE